MIILYNTFCQSKSKAPTSFLGRVPRIKNRFEIFPCNPLARIFYIDINLLLLRRHINIYTPFSIHRIDCILAQILYDPFK